MYTCRLGGPNARAAPARAGARASDHLELHERARDVLEELRVGGVVRFGRALLRVARVGERRRERRAQVGGRARVRVKVAAARRRRARVRAARGGGRGGES